MGADVLFLYTSRGAADEETINDCWKNKVAGKRYQHDYDEGYFKMLQRLFDSKVISKLTVIYESNIDYGRADFVKGASNYVIPRLSFDILDKFIHPKTIIFVRGGFKHWAEMLLPFKSFNWLMVYAANTGREKWAWWDIVFDDLNLGNFIDGQERYQFPFIKPVNEEIFKYKALPKKYDICIGASFIHDKKGQYIAIRLIEKFKEKYGYYPNCIMPGSPRRSTNTIHMMNSAFLNNECILPGMVTREELSEIFNQSSIFIHLGPGGQNDRSLAEAWACGCKLIYANLQRFSPAFKIDNKYIYRFDPHAHTKNIDKLNEILKELPVTEGNAKLLRQSIILKYKKNMGFEQVVIPRVKELFKKLPKLVPNLKNKNELVKTFNQFNCKINLD